MCAVRGSCVSTPTARTRVAVRKVMPRTRREPAQVSGSLKNADLLCADLQKLDCQCFVYVS